MLICCSQYPRKGLYQWYCQKDRTKARIAAGRLKHRLGALKNSVTRCCIMFVVDARVYPIDTLSNRFGCIKK